MMREGSAMVTGKDTRAPVRIRTPSRLPAAAERRQYGFAPRPTVVSRPSSTASCASRPVSRLSRSR